MERKNIPFTNKHFVEFVKKMCDLKSPYWYATCIFKCTESRYKSKKNQCPSHYTSDRTARYKADIAAKKISADCVGGCKGYAWTNGGEGVFEAWGTDKTFTNKSGSHGCPDKSANGMFTWAKSKGADWGEMKTMPELPGIALRFDGHVGYYIGGGYAVEWRGFAYGCVKTKVSGRKWTHWYKLPFIDYGEGALVDNGSVTYKLGDRVLKKGMKGTDVKELQLILMGAGYSMASYGADGDFGSVTLSAVASFQQEHEMEATGVCDAAMVAKLTDMGLMAVREAEPEQPATPETPEASQEATGEPVAAVGPMVKVTGASVFVRAGNGTQYAVTGTAKEGETFPLVATAENGWYAVEYVNAVCWISPKYSVIINKNE